MNINAARTLFEFKLFRVLMVFSMLANVLSGGEIRVIDIILCMIISFVVSLFVSKEHLISKYIQKEKDV